MNRVKRSLYLCIGVLLLLVGIQGVQSLWQVSRLSSAADDIVSTGKLSDDSRAVWNRFLEVEEVFRQTIAFVDAENADPLRKAFNAKAAALRDDTRRLSQDASGDLKAPAEALVSKVDAWLALAARHVGTEGVTELPSHHVLDAARADLDAGLRALIDRSEEVSTATVAASHALARNVSALTIAEMVAAIALGLLLGWHALKSLHRQLGADASEVARVTHAVADGDLSIRIPAEGVPEASVMAATARMQQAMLHTVDRVRGISHHLAGGAQEIATGKNMQDVVQSIRRVTDVMAEIRAASGEQSTGVAQVGRTIAELDQATQQNAALAEQTAAGAENLKTQGRQLVEAMAFFKLDGHDPERSAGNE